MDSLVRDRNQQGDLAKTVMNLRVLEKTGDLRPS
jgi:hypothetical protein